MKGIGINTVKLKKICLNITFDNFANTGGEIRIFSRMYDCIRNLCKCKTVYLYLFTSKRFSIKSTSTKMASVLVLNKLKYIQYIVFYNTCIHNRNFFTLKDLFLHIRTKFSNRVQVASIS